MRQGVGRERRVAKQRAQTSRHLKSQQVAKTENAAETDAPQAQTRDRGKSRGRTGENYPLTGGGLIGVGGALQEPDELIDSKPCLPDQGAKGTLGYSAMIRNNQASVRRVAVP